MQSKASTSSYKFPYGLSLMYFESRFFFWGGVTADITWDAPANNHLIYWVREGEPQNHMEFHLQNDSVNPLGKIILNNEQALQKKLKSFIMGHLLKR